MLHAVEKLFDPVFCSFNHSLSWQLSSSILAIKKLQLNIDYWMSIILLRIGNTSIQIICCVLVGLTKINITPCPHSAYLLFTLFLKHWVQRGKIPWRCSRKFIHVGFFLFFSFLFLIMASFFLFHYLHFPNLFLNGSKCPSLESSS